MNRTVVAVVLVAVFVSPRFAAAHAREPTPSIADMRAALERGDPRAALKMSSNALRLRDDAARGYDPYELLMVRGEALLAVGLPLDSADAYEHAAHVAPGLKERAAAHAEGLLALHAARRALRASDEGANAQSAVQAGARPPLRPDHEAWPRAMRELYQTLRPAVEAKVHAAVAGKTLPPLYSVLTPLIDLGSLELTADGTLEKSLPLLHELGEWASGVVAEELRRMDSEVIAAGEAAAAGEALHAEQRKALEEMKVTLCRLEPVTREGRQLAELLDERDRLLPVVHFDYLSLVLYEAATNVLRLHVLEAREPLSSPFEMVLSPEDDPAGLVWQTQQPLITSNVDELRRWPRLLERVQPYGVQSYCWLPLTTARRRLGALVFTSKQRSAYHSGDVGFLQQVANQVAVAVENALAFQEIEALKDKLAKEKAYLEEEVRTEHNFGDIVGDSPALRAVLRKVQIVAPTDSTVLVCGETGTGKELIARAAHDLSPRKGRTFVKLNCAAIPTGLLESELFGHEKGAFTGAISQRIGRFELANRGTLFLDEVGEIPLELQSKLLRVLQEQEFERLGSTRTIKVDVRLVAATNRDLGKMVAEGRFRSDLYYRLNVFPVVVPPLRERPDDIPRLVRHFTQHFARRMARRIEAIPSTVMEALVRYHWPGNVRELQNVIERAVILSPGATLQIPLNELEPAVTPLTPRIVTAVMTADAEREQIVAALRDTGWRVGGSSGAAARLGLKRTTLQKKMKKLCVSHPG